MFPRLLRIGPPLTAMIAVGVVTGFAAGAAAVEVRVGIPLEGPIVADEPIRWRDAAGRSGTDDEVAAASLRTPARLRGPASARSGQRSFPLPADVESYEGRRFAVITLSLESYLAGVVPSEMHADWPTEALKAQAVLARTFALRRRTGRRTAGAPLDVVAGTADQEYRWNRRSAPAIAAVLDDTAGLILAGKDGRPAEVFYHSCCGGQTAAAIETGYQTVPGIASITDPFCSSCPNYFWRLQISPAELGGVFGLGPVTQVRVLERGPSGRVTRLEMTDDARSQTLDGREFRARVGPERVRSTLFQIATAARDDGAVWAISGSGSGHGAGLCQFGARSMAEEGRSFREILAFYFPGLRLKEAEP